MHHQPEEQFIPSISPKRASDGAVEGTPKGELKGVEAFKQRLLERGFQKGAVTEFDELNRLYKEGDLEVLDSHIDDLVYQALAHDEEFVTNMQEIRASGGSRNRLKQDEALRARQNALFNEYKQTIVSMSGLPDIYGLDEYEVAKERIRSIIEESLSRNGHANDVLKALGMLTADQDGKDIFTYPKDLFPAETTKKWDLYLDRVREHLRIVRGVEAGTIDRSELVNADLMRKLAHDTVSKDVDTILGLNTVESLSWSFDKTRNLLAKMRDSRYPTVETAEKEKTTDEILRAANVLGILGTRLSDMRRKP